MGPTPEHPLTQRLWSEPGCRPWVVLDGAGVAGLLLLIPVNMQRGHAATLAGPAPRQTRKMAPQGHVTVACPG